MTGLHQAGSDSAGPVLGAWLLDGEDDKLSLSVKSSTIVNAVTYGQVNCGLIVLTVSALRDFLNDSWPAFGSKQELANQIGISASRLSRVIRGEDQDFTLGVISCLRLAKATGKHASFVLRLSGKDDIADMLEELYAWPAPSDLSAKIQRALKQDSESFLQIVDAWPAIEAGHRGLLAASAAAYSRVSQGAEKGAARAQSGGRTARPRKATTDARKGASGRKAGSA